jgi:lipopolysaccharide export system permease protein
MSSMDVAREIGKKAAAISEKVDEKRRQAYEAALDLEFSLRNGPSFPSWNERASAHGRLKQERSLAADVLKDRTLRVYRIEYFKKFSIPFGALSFIFLAIPLGLFTRKSGQSVGFGIGLIIAVFYWALLVGGQTLGVRLGYSPFWVMWLPNIVAVTFGTVLSILRVFL